MPIIALVNQREGVSNNATTFNLALAISGLGKEVLMVDLDPRGSLTETSCRPHHRFAIAFDGVRQDKHLYARHYTVSTLN